MRNQVFLILPFGQPVGHNHEYLYDFRRSGFASPSFGGFAFIGSLAALTQFSLRSMTLRRRVFPGFAFSRSNLIIARFFFGFNHSDVLIKFIQQQPAGKWFQPSCPSAGVHHFHPHES